MRFVSFAVITRPPLQHDTTPDLTNHLSANSPIIHQSHLPALQFNPATTVLVCLHVLVWTSCDAVVTMIKTAFSSPSPDSYACWPTDAHVLSSYPI